MRNLLVVDSPDHWPLDLPHVRPISARDYLTDPAYSQGRGTRVFNLCRSYRYQSLGYYVSLLAEARGHRPFPSIATVQDMRLPVVTRILSDDFLDELMTRALAPVRAKHFSLHVYFGRTVAKRYARLGRALFSLFPVPLIRAHFVRDEEDGWTLRHIGAIPASEIPERHHDFVVAAAGEHFSRPHVQKKSRPPRYDLAILWDEEDPHPPSDRRAVERFQRAADKLDMQAEIIGADDYEDIGEFDALFIRQTTAVPHHTYRFARRAEAEGLAVIDDPDSIVRCTNKVYLAELLGTHKIRAPRTLILRRENALCAVKELGFPCILKMPDSSFSQGVIKVESQILLLAELERCFEHSELLIAQEFLPTDFDWRIGVLDRRPLYACKYHMARHHWQIVKRGSSGKMRFGNVEPVPIELVPRRVLKTALDAARLVGDGLYGVDLKEIRGRCYVIEVNDNPNIDAGYEDAVLKQELYLRVMRVFLERIERIKQGGPSVRARGPAPL